MASEKDREEEQKSFVVKDRRFSAHKEEAEESKPGEEKKEEEMSRTIPSDEHIPLPEITFGTLIFSLSTSALIQLGEIEDPHGHQLSKNLPAAKQSIDIIAMLKEKTKGNLAPDEDKYLENILYDLKMRYVKAVG
jgi:hypothetical protein